MAQHNIVLDLKAGVSESCPAITIRQGEFGSEVINAAIMDDGAPADLANCSAIFNCITAGGNVVSDGQCEIEGNVITYTISEFVGATAGLIRLAYFDVMTGNAYRDSTEGMRITVIPSNSSTIPQDYFQSLDQAIAQYYAAIAGAKAQTSNQAAAYAEAEASRNAANSAAVQLATSTANMTREVAIQAMVLVDRAQDSILYPNDVSSIALAFNQIGRGCKCVDWLFLFHRLYCHTDAASYDAETRRIGLKGFRYDADTQRVIQTSE